MNLKHHIKWFDEIKGQFRYGGQKYAHSNQKESTDVLFENFGKNWLFGTLAKYIFRYRNKARERDLLKIACYSFILWLKRGFHLDRKGSKGIINTTVDIKSKYFQTFSNRVFDFIGDFNDLDLSLEIALDKIYDMLYYFGKTEFQEIKESQLFEIFALCYYIWENDIPTEQKGTDQDIYNATDRK